MMIPVVIPTYEPDERFVVLIQNLIDKKITPIVVVDDGSSEVYQKFFLRAAEILKTNGVILKHDTNQGKGRALKTAFEYVLKTYPTALGCVTADCDGQHSPDCIEKMRHEFKTHENDLLLGVRCFDFKNIPWKSKLGNCFTRFICKFFVNLDVHDTQTGLRCIPLSLMPELLNLKGNRFEYEMQMLIYCAGKRKITEVPIETIYDCKENHQTHFKPFADSIKIYAVIFKQFYHYIISSVLSFVFDVTLFWFFCRLLKESCASTYIVWATVLARILSAGFNIVLNYSVVFKSHANFAYSSFKYGVLAVCIMLLSAAFVSGFAFLWPAVSPVYIKIIVDSFLFMLSFYMQKKYVF